MARGGGDVERRMVQAWDERVENHLVDTHCHLDFLFGRDHYEKELTSLSEFRRQYRVPFPRAFYGCIAVFCDPKSFNPPKEGPWLLETVCSDSYVHPIVGCHPKNVERFTPRLMKDFELLIENPRVVAVGEMGLDYSGTWKQHECAQKQMFRYQLEQARRINKPVVLHCRDAEDDCHKIVREVLPHDYRIHMHCWTNDSVALKPWLEYFPNLYVGITPLVGYKSSAKVKDTAFKVPLDKLLLETDAPYFIPHKVPRKQMKLSHPGMAMATAEAVANIRSVTLDEVLKQTHANAKSMYGVF